MACLSNAIYLYRSMNNILDNGDTLSGNDLVIRQYENLPFPPFGEDRIVEEKIGTEMRQPTYGHFQVFDSKR